MIQTFLTHRLADQTVRALNTGRTRETEMVMDAVHRNLTVTPGLLQHVMIYGPRGFGKSFMTRVIQLETAELNLKERPAVYLLLPEEQRNVIRNPHALLNDLAIRLADWRTGEDRTWTEAFFRWPRPDQEAALWDAAVARLERELDESLGGTSGLVIAAVENFDTLLATVFKADTAEQRLRKWLGRGGNRLMLLATGTRTADIDYDRPLFQAFQSVWLEPWTRDECIDYFNRRRAMEGREPLDGRIEPKARAIADFIGGNPRLAQLLGEVLDTDDAWTVVAAMNALADRLADYYRRRIDDLPPLAQGLVDALIRGDEPCSATELARRVGAEQSDIARVMQDLRHADIIRGTPVPDGKETMFRVVDRVFVHYYRLRQLEVLEGRSPLVTILDLLRTFYTRDEQRWQAAHYLDLGRPDDASVFSAILLESVIDTAQSSYISGFGNRLRRYMAMFPATIDLGADEIMAALSGEQRVRFEARCVPKPDDRPIGRAMLDAIRAQIRCRMGLVEHSEDLLKSTLDEIDGEPRAAFIASSELGHLLLDERNEVSQAVATWTRFPLFPNEWMSYAMLAAICFDRSLSLVKSKSATEALKWVEYANSLAAAAGDTSIRFLITWLKVVILAGLDRHEETIAAASDAARWCANAGATHEHAASLHLKGRALCGLGRYEEAVTAYGEAAALLTFGANLPQQAAILIDLGNSLGSLHQFVAAAERFREAAALSAKAGDKRKQCQAMRFLAAALLGLGKHKAAILAADTAADLAVDVGDNAERSLALTVNATAHLALDQYEAANSAATEAAELAANLGDRAANSQALVLSGTSLLRLNRPDEAAAQWRIALEYAVAASNLTVGCAAAYGLLTAGMVNPDPECVSVYSTWINLRQSTSVSVSDPPAAAFDRLVAAVMRAVAWDAFDRFLDDNGDWINANRALLTTRTIGEVLARIDTQTDRPTAFEAARQALRRLTLLFPTSRLGPHTIDWLHPVISAFARNCRNVGLTRDIAGLIEPSMAPDAERLRSLLRQLADFDDGPGGEAGLARLDPDVATWIRRMRELPDEPTSRPGSAKRRNNRRT